MTRLRRVIGATTAILLVAAGSISAVQALAPAIADADTPTHYYLDCAEGNDAAAGTSTATPWKTLAKLNSIRYRAGDTISLRAGVSCEGTATPSGSGTAAAPIMLNSYGSGGKPKIVASNARAAIYLHNVQGWEIRDLDITDRGGAGSPRVGVYVEDDDQGIVSHFVVDSVIVHDINGCDCTGFDQPSGGILFRAGGMSTPTGFSGITVSNSTVRHTDGIGIGTISLWAKRDFFYPEGPGTRFVPESGVLIENNAVSDQGGDGIVVQNGTNAIMRHNMVNGYSLRATAYHSGIWAWNSDDSLIEFNDISHGGREPLNVNLAAAFTPDVRNRLVASSDIGNGGPLAASAFDVDGGNNGVTYQHNSTHDNGAMLLACAIKGLNSRGARIIANTSNNDLDNGQGVVTISCQPQQDFRFDRNTVTAPNAATIIQNKSTTSGLFTNNVFTGRRSGSTISDTYSVFRGNVFRNIINPPTQSS
ncbi:MAG: right-handed parallel beta-helix repeat-containing protein [Pseudonocardia sp.]|nr:right-handed parallel beta-helix repeat-containing protein [Pseudonocardia sp.]